MNATEKSLLDQHYSWEELNDIEQHVFEAIQDAELDGEFAGTIRIRVDFIPDIE